MSDNPQYGTVTPFALPGIRVIALGGRDAIAFAQSQFMNDVAALGDGQWQWNGWLDPKGRVQALFALLRLDVETLWLLTTSELDVATSLGRFVFRSKLRIDTLRLRASGALQRPAHATGATAFRQGDAVELDLSGDAGARTLRLSSETLPSSDASAAAWWALDLVHGWPGIPGARLSNSTPQQLSLQRLAAFSVKKGCYPGQEIVARTHFLGRAKRGLARIEVPSAVAGDAIVDGTGRDVGSIVAATGGVALAVLPLEHPDGAAYRLGDTPVDLLPLANGLAR